MPDRRSAAARHVAGCDACSLIVSFVHGCGCGHTTSCEDELARAIASGAPFLGRYALAPTGYRDALLPRAARDLETGEDVIVRWADDAPADMRTRCGAVVVARAHPATDTGGMADGEELEERVRALLAANDAGGALTAVREAYGADLERYVRYRRSSRAKLGVEDICQEVWASVTRGLPAFRFEAPLRAWLFSIASRRIIDVARRGPADDEQDSERLAAIRDSLTGPLSRLLRDERAAAVRSVLERCDPEDAELLQLRFAFDLPPREIAFILAHGGEPEKANTIAQRIARLLVKLGKELSKQDLFRSRVE